MKRSQRKKQQKAERQVKAKDPSKKSGFRKLTVDGAVYQFKIGKQFTEIRVPGKLNLKWLVPNWQLSGFDSFELWKVVAVGYPDCGDSDCDFEYCVTHSERMAITPKKIRQYIEEMRTVTCNEGGTCGCKK